MCVLQCVAACCHVTCHGVRVMSHDTTCHTICDIYVKICVCCNVLQCVIVTHDVRQISLKMLHFGNPPNRETQIPRYKFK